MFVAPQVNLLRYGATLPIDRIDSLCGLWNEASSLVFSRPFTISSIGELEPDVVGHHEVSPDGLTHRMRVRPDVYWHDNCPLTTEDLEFSLQLATDQQYRGMFKLFINDVSRVYSAGDEVVVEVHRPNPGLLYKLAKVCIVRADLATPRQLADGWLSANPIGTGPYRLAERTELGVIFSSHKKFHGHVAAIENIAMTQIVEDSDRAAALAAGQIDLAQVKAQQRDLLATVPGVKVHTIGTRVWRSLTFSLTHPLLQDPLVRRGLSELIDRQEIVDRALGGNGRPQIYPTPPTSWANREQWPPVGKTQAFQTLREAGMELNEAGVWARDGKELSLNFAFLESETFRKVTSEVIAEQFSAAGIPVELNPITWAQYSDMDDTGLRGAGFDGIVVGWSGGVDPYENLAIRYSTEGAYNRDGYSDREMDELLEKAVNAPDAETAKPYYHRILELTHRDSIMAPLVNPQYLFAGRTDLTGFEEFEVDSFYEFPQYLNLIHRLE